MKAATSEVTLTIVAIVAIGTVLLFITGFLGEAGIRIQEMWNKMTGGNQVSIVEKI